MFTNNLNIAMRYFRSFLRNELQIAEEVEEVVWAEEVLEEEVVLDEEVLDEVVLEEDGDDFDYEAIEREYWMIGLRWICREIREKQMVKERKIAEEEAKVEEAKKMAKKKAKKMAKEARKKARKAAAKKAKMEADMLVISNARIW